MLGRISYGRYLCVRLPHLRGKKAFSPGITQLTVQSFATKTGASKESLPDTDYNIYDKISTDKYPRTDHWDSKFSDIRWQYLQDPEVAKGNIVPIIRKESPERDSVNWPRAMKTEMSGRVRMLLFPEEFFNYLYSKTGVTGPYFLIWGSLAYLWSQEMIRFDHEASLLVECVLIPLFAYHRILAPRMYTFLCREEQFEKDAFGALIDYNIGKLELTTMNERLDFEMSRSASKYTFDAKKEMFRLQWESTYRKRVYEAFAKVKQRLDFYAELEACKARHESKHMVNWIVDSVLESITPEQESGTLTKCLSDLKTMSASVKL